MFLRTSSRVMSCANPFNTSENFSPFTMASSNADEKVRPSSSAMLFCFSIFSLPPSNSLLMASEYCDCEIDPRSSAWLSSSMSCQAFST